MKKGQLSAFVIIGLVLIIIIAISLYVVSKINEPRNIEEEYTTVVPPALEPLKSLYQQCLLDVAKEGFIIAGQQGGYVYPDRARIVPIDGRETSSKGIHLAPGTNITIPYWWYLASSNNCTTCEFGTQIPSLNDDLTGISIESEVADYVTENYFDCINTEVFETRGFTIEETGNLFVQVKIGENDVGLFMDYPIEVKYENKIVKMEKFQGKLDLDIKSMYDLGVELIQEWEVSNTKAFEYVAVQLLNGYSVESSGYDIPPISGPVKFGFSNPKRWILPEVKENIKTILTQNVPLMQVLGSREYNIYLWDSVMSDEFYDGFIMPVSNVPQADLERISVDFNYLPWWDIYTKVNPSKGYLITPDAPISVNLILMRFSMQRYKFSYDLAYPVMVTLKDEDTLSGEGYVFQFAVESNIRNNLPLNTTPFDLRRASGSSETLFPNLNQRSASALIKTVDALTGEPIPDALVSYYCGQDLIHLGETLMKDGDALLESNLPPCHGAILVALKEGYVADPQGVTFIDDDYKELTLNLNPIVTKKLSVQKRLIVKKLDVSNLFIQSYWDYTNTESDLDLDDELLLIIERQSEFEDDFASIVTFTGENASDQTIELAVGNYSLEAVLFRQFGENHSLNSFIIPEREECEGGGLFSDEECYTIPEIKFETTYYLGGLTLDKTTGYFNITKEDLEKDTLIVYVVAQNFEDIEDIEDLEVLDKFDDFAIANLDNVIPVFS